MAGHQQTTRDFPDIEATRHAWDQIAFGYDAHVTPSHFWLAEEAIRRMDLEPGARFLDVAAGSGALSIAAARRGAHVVATDLSPNMIERLKARASAEGLSNVSAQVMDGHNLTFEDDHFDAAGSQFGVMLFPDLPRGLREMVRVTRPGGRVVMVTFGGSPQEVEFLRFFMQAAHLAVPDFGGPPMDPPPLPFQVADPAKLKRELELAGARDVIIERVTESLSFSSADEMLTWLANSNPIGTALIGGLSDTERREVERILAGMLRERAGASVTARLTHPINIGIGTI